MVGFAVGLGAFAQGMGQGMQMGQQIRGALDDRKLRRANREGAEAATAARESDIAAAIQTTPNPDGTQTFKVGDQTFNDAGKAKSAATGQVGSVMDYYRTNTVPKLIETYTKIGQPDKAQQLQAWMETEESNGITRDWARAARMATLGDTKAAMRGFGKLYERMEPGSKYLGMEELSEPIYEDEPGKDGKPSKKQVGTRPAGVRLKLRSADGEDVVHDFSGTEDLFQTALMTLSPDKFVGRALGEVDQARASRAEVAKETRKFSQDVQLEKLKAVTADARDQRQHERTIIRSDREYGQTVQRDASRQNYDLEKIMTTKQLEVAMAPALEAAKAKGDTPDDARKAIGAIWKTLTENSAGTNSFSTKPVEEQIKQAAELYRKQDTAARGVIAGGAANPTTRGIPRLY